MWPHVLQVGANLQGKAGQIADKVLAPNAGALWCSRCPQKGCVVCLLTAWGAAPACSTWTGRKYAGTRICCACAAAYYGVRCSTGCYIMGSPSGFVMLCRRVTSRAHPRTATPPRARPRCGDGPAQDVAHVNMCPLLSTELLKAFQFLSYLPRCCPRMQKLQQECVHRLLQIACTESARRFACVLNKSRVTVKC